MKRYTTWDIAKRLGMSRTTVSRALNGHPEVSETTRRLVRSMARKLGYAHRAGAVQKTPLQAGIVLLIKSSLNILGDNYWGELLRGVEEASRGAGVPMLLHVVREEDLEQGILPSTVSPSSGLLLAGITGRSYVQAASQLGLPLVMIDGYTEWRPSDRVGDLVLMENERSFYRLTSDLIAQGHTRIGFVGDVGNCRSFQERWWGFRQALWDAQLPQLEAFCLTSPSISNYFDDRELASTIQMWTAFPSAIVCANDLIAYQLMEMLQRMGIRVPDDVSVTGFDGIRPPAHPATLPSLTTVRISGHLLGTRAFEQLVWRAGHPEYPMEDVRISGTPVNGKSTARPRNAQHLSMEGFCIEPISDMV